MLFEHVGDDVRVEQPQRHRLSSGAPRSTQTGQESLEVGIVFPQVRPCPEECIEVLRDGDALLRGQLSRRLRSPVC